MGGKSRKTGGVSKSLINRIKKGKCCGSNNKKDKGQDLGLVSDNTEQARD